jgi:hypothetical protein
LARKLYLKVKVMFAFSRHALLGLLKVPIGYVRLDVDQGLRVIPERGVKVPFWYLFDSSDFVHTFEHSNLPPFCFLAQISIFYSKHLVQLNVKVSMLVLIV